MWRKIQNWSGKKLSKAGREVLIKSVAQAIPTYCMSAFMIPTTLCEELERMMNSFWWGNNTRERGGIRWMRWEKLTLRKEYGGLGFRHLQGFNMAMLGKQAWKIANHADTIVAQVFKAKYFPDGNFMGARLGHNPSYVWRSIFASRAIVELGARWKIGNGETISVWHDPWLKGGGDAFVRSPIPNGLEQLRVKDLWRPATNDWDRELINNIFNSQEASRIVSLPILNNLDEDKLVWGRSRNGVYSVKSAYYTYMEELVNRNHLRVEGEWLRIWKLKVPNKVKVLLWRAARGCLPTRCNLQSRHVPCDWLCPFCERNPENEWHIFFACPHNEGAWRLSGLWDQVQVVMDTAESFREGFFALFGALDVGMRRTAAMVFWALWKRRNDKVWEGAVQPLQIVVERAMDFLVEWAAMRLCTAANIAAAPDGGNASNITDVTQWERPAPGEFKCNVDAALFVAENKYGIGICIRRDSGEFYKAKSLWFDGIPSPQEAEAMGLWQALLWLRDLGLSIVSIELDCLPVVSGVREETNTDTEFGSLISYCKNFLSTFQSFKVGFVRRQANCVAHSLARASRCYASSIVFDYIPTCIESIVMNEMR